MNKMNSLIKIFWFIAVTSIFLGSFSCTCVHKKDKAENMKQQVGKTDTTSRLQETVLYLLPSPGEILEEIQNANIKFNSAILNPAENSGKYLGLRAQALNLGVYITDMAYSALCGRSTETVEFLETIRTLSNETGISSSVFELLLERAKVNTGNMDSLLNISNEAFSNMLEFLETGGRENTLAFVSTGAYIESLYLALKSVNTYSPGDPVIELISRMKYPLDNLFERTKNAPKDENVVSILNYLDQIEVIYNDLELKSSKTTISETEKGKISILGGGKLNMDEKNYSSLKHKIIQIRSTIVDY